MSEVVWVPDADDVAVVRKATAPDAKTIEGNTQNIYAPLT